MPIFGFPDEVRWDEARRTVEFQVTVGEYQGWVRIPAQLFQGIGRNPGEAECLAAFHANRTGFERIAERKIEARDLAPDGNIELNRNDLHRR